MLSLLARYASRRLAEENHMLRARLNTAQTDNGLLRRGSAALVSDLAAERGLTSDLRRQVAELQTENGRLEMEARERGFAERVG